MATLSLKGVSKKGNAAYYTGLRNVLRIAIDTFPDKKAPATLEISGDFAGARTAKVKETPEARKARLAALPKLTLAEKIARREEALAKLKAKAAKAAA